MKLNKIALALVTLLVVLQASPILAHAQIVTVTESYQPFYINGMNYKDNNGVATANNDYDITAKMVIKNDSINLNMNTFHYVHFWDNANTYLGHYATTTADTCSTDCIGTLPSSISTSYAIPIPPTSYTFALERFDRADANYQVTSGTTLTDMFDDENLVGDSNFNDYITYNSIGVLDFFANSTTVIVDNLVLNGDFSVDSNSDGLGDFWSSSGTINRSIVGGVQKAFANGTSYLPDIQQNKALPFNNTYYIRSTFNTNNTTHNKVLRVNRTTTFQDIYTVLPASNPGSRSDVFTLNTYNSVNIQFFINGYTGPATPPPSTDYLEISIVMLVNLTTLVNQGLIASATVNSFETWLTTNTNISVGQYFDDIKHSQYVGLWKNYYLLWQNNTVAGLETIDQNYYLNGDEKKIINLTDIFGSGSEPNLATMQGYLTDYLYLDEHSNITLTAWTNQAITSSTFVWDDRVAPTLENGFLILISGAIGFLTMLFGIAKRNPLFHVISIGAFILFTVQFTHIAMIIVGIALMIINALYIAGRRV